VKEHLSFYTGLWADLATLMLLPITFYKGYKIIILDLPIYTQNILKRMWKVLQNMLKILSHLRV
jgi:hypothetical protein